MVLDAEGHSYRFVREEAPEGELAIVDDSRDMPKDVSRGRIFCGVCQQIRPPDTFVFAQKHGV